MKRSSPLAPNPGALLKLVDRETTVLNVIKYCFYPLYKLRKESKINLANIRSLTVPISSHNYGAGKTVFGVYFSRFVNNINDFGGYEDEFVLMMRKIPSVLVDLTASVCMSSTAVENKPLGGTSVGKYAKNNPVLIVLDEIQKRDDVQGC